MLWPRPRLIGALLGLFMLSAVPGFPAEEISPQPQTPFSAEPGLSDRAVPTPAEPDYEALQGSYVPLYRLTRPYYDSVFAVPEPDAYQPPDPSTYRDVLAYEPPLGLQPLFPKPGLFTLSPFAGVTQTYDTNLRLSSSNHVADTYTTLTAGTDFQLGSPDSIHTEGYDTILALHGRYLFSTDIFADDQQFNAINNRLNLDGRIGRDEAIWRPYLTMEQFTSTDFEDRNTEQIGRLQRQILAPGFVGNYKVASNLTVNQDFSWDHLEHPEPGYINTDTWNLMQDVGTPVLQNVDAFVWNDLRQTQPSIGADVNEVTSGVGWRGMPDPRIFTEFRIGWDVMQWSNADPNRKDLSGWRMGGHTTFDWGPRLRLSLKYDRNYIFNEVNPDDNYTSTVAQFVPEIYLGANFYLTPYIAVTDYSYEQQRLEQIETRFETEFSYRFGARRDADSRVYIKGAYLRNDQTYGAPNQGTIDDYRFTVGMAYKF